MLNAVPRVVLAPLFLLWLGLGIWSKVALAVTLVFFVMFFTRIKACATPTACSSTTSRMLGRVRAAARASRARAERADLSLPSLQTSLGFAMVGAVVGEFSARRAPSAT